MATSPIKQEESQRLQQILERVKKKVAPLKRTIILSNPLPLALRDTSFRSSPDDSDSMDYDYDSPISPEPTHRSQGNGNMANFYVLEEIFETNTNPSNSEVLKITCETGLSCEQVKRWFRRKRKKKSIVETVAKVRTPPGQRRAHSRHPSDSESRRCNVVALRSNHYPEGNSIPIVVGNRPEESGPPVHCYPPRFDSGKPQTPPPPPEAITYNQPPTPFLRGEPSHISHTVNTISTMTDRTLERFTSLLNSTDWDDAASRLLALATSNIPLAAVVLKESKLLKEDVLPSWFPLGFSQQLQIIQWKENYLMKSHPKTDNDVRGMRVVLESVVIPWIPMFVYGKLTPDEENCKGLSRALRDACKGIQNQAVREHKWQVPLLIDQ